MAEGVGGRLGGMETFGVHQFVGIGSGGVGKSRNDQQEEEGDGGDGKGFVQIDGVMSRLSSRGSGIQSSGF